MSRRKPKVYPPGTFIPMPQRMMAIIQLCLAFMLMFWILCQPFMGEYFNLRSRMLIYEYAMGTSSILKSREGQEAKLERQAARFEHLPDSEKELLSEDYRNLKDYAQRPALEKIENGFRSLIQKVPPFEQAWIFFSIFISIALLLKREGAKSAAWLLPLIVIAYAADNRMSGKPSNADPDHQLFPAEQVIIEKYLNEPFSSSPQEQRDQLEKGWKSYLVKNWSARPGMNENHDQLLEEGEFNFTLARLKLLHAQPRSEWLNTFHQKINPLLLIIYFIWNVLFAWVVSQPKLTLKKIMRIDLTLE